MSNTARPFLYIFVEVFRYLLRSFLWSLNCRYHFWKWGRNIANVTKHNVKLSSTNDLVREHFCINHVSCSSVTVLVQQWRQQLPWSHTTSLRSQIMSFVFTVLDEWHTVHPKQWVTLCKIKGKGDQAFLNLTYTIYILQDGTCKTITAAEINIQRCLLWLL